MNNLLYERALTMKKNFLSWADYAKIEKPYDSYAIDFFQSFSFTIEHLECLSDKSVSEFLNASQELIDWLKKECPEKIVLSEKSFQGPICNTKDLCRWLYTYPFPSFQARIEAQNLIEHLKHNGNLNKPFVAPHENELKNMPFETII